MWERVSSSEKGASSSEKELSLRRGRSRTGVLEKFRISSAISSGERTKSEERRALLLDYAGADFRLLCPVAVLCGGVLGEGRDDGFGCGADGDLSDAAGETVGQSAAGNKLRGTDCYTFSEKCIEKSYREYLLHM